MSVPVQTFLLKYLRPVKTLVNDKLAKRPGIIGGLFNRLKLGKREYGVHFYPRVGIMVNYMIMCQFTMLSAGRQVFSRFAGAVYGPLNYTGLISWMCVSAAIMFKFPHYRMRDVAQFNEQDNL